MSLKTSKFPQSNVVAALLSFFVAAIVAVLLLPQWNIHFFSPAVQLQVAYVISGLADEIIVQPRASLNSADTSYRIPVARRSSDQNQTENNWNVEIQATGRKNPSAAANEIQVFEISTELENKPLAETTMIGSPWEFKDDPRLSDRPHAFASPSGNPQTLRTSLSGTHLRLKFLRHHRGGIVRLTVNGETQEIDLYAAENAPQRGFFKLELLHPSMLSTLVSKQGTAEVSIPASALAEPLVWFSVSPDSQLTIKSVKLNGSALAVEENRVSVPRDLVSRALSPYIFSGFLSLSLAAVFFLGFRLWMLGNRASPLHALIWQLAAGVIISGFWTSVFFPALMSGDSLAQWREGVQNEYSTWYPVLMAQIMRVTWLICKSPWLFAFIQGSLFWFSLFFALSAVLPNPRIWLPGSILFAANPALWTYTSVLWKDVWTASFVVLSGAYATIYYRNNKIASLILSCLFALLAAAFRHNAVVLVIFPVALLLFFVRWPWKKKLLVVCFLPVLFSGLPKALNLMAHARHSPQSGSAFIEQYVALLVFLQKYHPAEFASEVATFDSKFGDGKAARAISVYSPTYPAGGLLWPAKGEPPIITRHQMYDHLPFVLARIAKLSFKYPRGFLRHRWLNIKGLVQWDSVPYPYHSQIDRNSMGIQEASLLPKARSAVFTLLSKVRTSVLFRHYVFILVLLAAMPACLALRWKTPLMFVTIGILYLFSLLICDVWSDWRFLLPTYCCSLTVGYALLIFSISPLVNRFKARTNKISGDSAQKNLESVSKDSCSTTS